MKKYINLLGGMLIAMTLVAFNTGCAPKSMASPLGPSDVVLNPPVVPTPGTTPVTSTAKTRYLKIIGTPGIISTFNVQVLVTTAGPTTTYLHNGSVTLDSTNSYQWSSPQSNPYNTGDATFTFSLTAPSNQGLTDELHRVAVSTGIDSVTGTGYPGPNGPDGGSVSY